MVIYGIGNLWVNRILGIHVDTSVANWAHSLRWGQATKNEHDIRNWNVTLRLNMRASLHATVSTMFALRQATFKLIKSFRCTYNQGNYIVHQVAKLWFCAALGRSPSPHENRFRIYQAPVTASDLTFRPLSKSVGEIFIYLNITSSSLMQTLVTQVFYLKMKLALFVI